MSTTTTPATLTASAAAPVSIYYCKAGIATGQTVRLTQGSTRISCRGVAFTAASGTMIHGNSRGKAKASGARCVLELVAGTITIDPD